MSNTEKKKKSEDGNTKKTLVFGSERFRREKGCASRNRIKAPQE
jgi:hypothetical protein